MSPSKGAPIEIQISTAVGQGGTPLSAFDNALVATGTANFNLVRLSSVIPPASRLTQVDRVVASGQWGDRLYVVYAQQSATVPGDEAWAGIGWVTDPDTSRGLFVEHEGDTEQSVRDDILASLDDLQKSRDCYLGPSNLVVTGGRCLDRPVCALVIAVYGSSAWSDIAA